MPIGFEPISRTNLRVMVSENKHVDESKESNKFSWNFGTYSLGT